MDSLCSERLFHKEGVVRQPNDFLGELRTCPDLLALLKIVAEHSAQGGDYGWDAGCMRTGEKNITIVEFKRQ